MSWLPEPIDWPHLKKDPSDADAHVRDLLPAWVNGTLDPFEVPRVVAHLERCAGCRAAQAAWERIAGAVGASNPARQAVNERPLRRIMAATECSADAGSGRVATLDPPPTDFGPVIGGGAAMSDVTLPTPYRAPSTLAPHPGRARRRQPVMNELSAAAVMILILAGLFAAYRLRPDGDDTTLPGAAGSETPPSNTSARVLGPEEAIDIADCSTQPRPPGTVEVLIQTDARTPPSLPTAEAVDADVLFAGLPAPDEATRSAIGTTLRQLTACRFYATDFGSDRSQIEDYDDRFHALFSDDFLRRNIAQQRAIGAQLPPFFFMVATSRPLEVVESWVLQDGRVAVAVHEPGFDPRDVDVLVLARSDDRWLVDEVGALASASERVTPFASIHPMELVLIDDDAYPRGGSSFPSGSEINLTVANLGSKTQFLGIEQTGVDLMIDPGHSVEVALTLAPGTYQLGSFVLAGGGGGSDLNVLEPTFYATVEIVDVWTPEARG
jgi:hypothetical protein